jgi:hypothetical protein
VGKALQNKSLLKLSAFSGYVSFSLNPTGKAAELKQSAKDFVDAMKNFKVTSDRIIVDNIIP